MSIILTKAEAYCTISITEPATPMATFSSSYAQPGGTFIVEGWYYASVSQTNLHAAATNTIIC